MANQINIKSLPDLNETKKPTLFGKLGDKYPDLYLKWLDWLDFWSKITKPFWLTKNFLVRLWAYTPILWRDKDFDWVFIMEMFRFKLKRTREYLIKENMIGDIQEVSEQIEKAEKLIGCILNNNFAEKEHEDHEKRWGEMKIEFKDLASSNAKTLHFTHPKANTEKEIAQEKAEREDIYELEKRREDTTWDELFIHLKANMKNWWS